MTKVRYQVPKYRGARFYEIELRYRVDLTEDHEKTMVAEECAKDFFNNRDGFEAKWPLDISTISVDGYAPFNCSVELESEPVFSASLN